MTAQSLRRLSLLSVLFVGQLTTTRSKRSCEPQLFLEGYGAKALWGGYT